MRLAGEMPVLRFPPPDYFAVVLVRAPLHGRYEAKTWGWWFGFDSAQGEVVERRQYVACIHAHKLCMRNNLPRPQTLPAHAVRVGRPVIVCSCGCVCVLCVRARVCTRLIVLRGRRRELAPLQRKLDDINNKRDELMTAARQQVGVWSEYGVSAVRQHFWSKMERAQAGAKRQTCVRASEGA
jgi:hypothetical protein